MTASQSKTNYERRRDKFVKNFINIADPQTGIRSILKKSLKETCSDLFESNPIFSDDLWKPLMVPLQISTISVLEVYLEELFLEKLTNKNFLEAKDLFKTPHELNNLYSKFPTINKNIVKSHFSFQRLHLVEELYLKTMNCNIKNFSDYKVIKFNFDIRHQFTHDCAKVTSDYINAHNTFFQNAPSKQFPPSAIGRDLTREISSVKSLLDLIEQAIDFIKLHGIILTKKVAEEDSKSAASNGVGVQVPFRAP